MFRDPSEADAGGAIELDRERAGPREPSHDRSAVDPASSLRASAAHVHSYVWFQIVTGDVEDLTSKVYQRGVAGPVTAEPGAWPAWLFRVAHNAIVDHYRRRRFPEPLGAMLERPDDAPSLPDRVDPRRAGSRRRGRAARDPGRQRAAVYLRHYEGLPYDQVASILGVPAATARSLVHAGSSASRPSSTARRCADSRPTTPICSRLPKTWRRPACRWPTRSPAERTPAISPSCDRSCARSAPCVRTPRRPAWRRRSTPLHHSRSPGGPSGGSPSAAIVSVARRGLALGRLPSSSSASSRSRSAARRHRAGRFAVAAQPRTRRLSRRRLHARRDALRDGPSDQAERFAEPSPPRPPPHRRRHHRPDGGPLPRRRQGLPPIDSSPLPAPNLAFWTVEGETIHILIWDPMTNEMAETATVETWTGDTIERTVLFAPNGAQFAVHEIDVTTSSPVHASASSPSAASCVGRRRA